MKSLKERISDARRKYNSCLDDLQTARDRADSAQYALAELCTEELNELRQELENLNQVKP